MGQSMTERPTVTIDGIDLDAIQVEYFDGDAIGDIAVGVTDDRSTDLPALVVPAGDTLQFEHDGDAIDVTLAAIQFEGPSPLVWFDRA